MLYTRLCMITREVSRCAIASHGPSYMYRYSLWPCKLPVLTCHIVAHVDLFRKGQLVSLVLFKRVQSVYTPSNVREI